MVLNERSEKNPLFGFDCSIDYDRLHYLLDLNLSYFLNNVGGSLPLSVSHEASAAFITWISVFIPESVTTAFRNKLRQAVLEYQKLPRFKSNWWWRILDLHAALFAIDGDTSWISWHILNINHHNSTLRQYVLCTALLIADRINFYDADLQNSVKDNVVFGHYYADMSLLLLAFTKGDIDDKRRLFMDLRVLCKDTISNDCAKLLDDLLNGDLVKNPFNEQSLWTQKIVCLKLLSEKPRPNIQLPFINSLPVENPLPALSDNEEQSFFPGLEPSTTTFNLQDIWDRMDAHPLMQSYVSWPKIKSDK